jgi:hypothetical protein
MVRRIPTQIHGSRKVRIFFENSIASSPRMTQPLGEGIRTGWNIIEP